MKEYKNQVGLKVIAFTDLNDETCILQESSLATESAIRFGLYKNKMHLTQDQVKELLPYLQRFADKGEL